MFSSLKIVQYPTTLFWDIIRHILLETGPTMKHFTYKNIFVEFRGRRLQQDVDISMGPNCTPILVDFSYFHINQTIVKIERSKKFCHLILHKGTLMMKQV